MDIQIPDNCRALHKYFAAGWRGKPRELLCFKTGKVTMADTRSRSQEKGGKGGWLIETELIKYLRQSRFMISRQNCHFSKIVYNGEIKLIIRAEREKKNREYIREEIRKSCFDLKSL